MITVLDFDDLYDKEEFYKSAPYQRIGLTEVQGTNGYCEDTAAETIRERFRKLPLCLLSSAKRDVQGFYAGAV